MCTTCGCDAAAGLRLTPIGHEHGAHEHGATETIAIEQQILAKNDLTAARNRDWLVSRSISAFNVLSSPGAGKTTLLGRTATEIATATGDERPIAVIEGDQETLIDAERIREAGVPVVQINTGAGCHLDAEMVEQGLARLRPERGTLLLIENVGNLVCPALFDLGETAKVVVTSVTEGDDKPLKYPHMFSAADLVVINKSDLLPYVQFDVDSFVAAARRLRPDLPCLVVSATTGDGLEDWYAWLSSADQMRSTVGPT